MDRRVDPRSPHCLQQVERPDDVRLQGVPRGDEARGDVGLGGQVEDVVRPALGDRRVHARFVDEVALHQFQLVCDADDVVHGASPAAGAVDLGIHA